MSRYSDLSKQIGYSEPTITSFPVRAQVAVAFALRKDAQILRWYRFLREARTTEEAAINAYICECYAAIRTDLERDQLPDYTRIPLAKDIR